MITTHSHLKSEADIFEEFKKIQGSHGTRIIISSLTPANGVNSRVGNSTVTTVVPIVDDDDDEVEIVTPKGRFHEIFELISSFPSLPPSVSAPPSLSLYLFLLLLSP